MWAGERAWLGNVDAFQLEWSYRYRSFDHEPGSAPIEFDNDISKQGRFLVEFIDQVNAAHGHPTSGLGIPGDHSTYDDAYEWDTVYSEVETFQQTILRSEERR